MTTYKEEKRTHLFELRPKAYAYGYSAGILQLESNILPIPGDVNNATTYNFPVLYTPVTGATAERVASGDPALEEAVVAAAQALADQGVRYIVANSGLFARYQEALTRAVTIPVINSLLLLPIIAEQFLGGQKTLCVLTADASLLNAQFLQDVGLGTHSNVVVAGMEAEAAFRDQILGESDRVDSDAIATEVVTVAQRAVAQNTNVKAFLLESSMLPPYAHAIQSATGLPVYDLTNATDYLHEATHREEYHTDY